MAARCFPSTALALILASLLALAAAAPAVFAEQAPVVQGIEVIDHGIFSSVVVTDEHDPGVADNRRIIATDYLLLERTDLVPAELDIGFGMAYVLQGDPQGAEVPVEVVVQHPPITAPECSTPSTVSRATFTRVIGQEEHSVWSFDDEFSLVPGEYVIQIVYQGQVLAEHAFTVYNPDRP